MSTRSSSRSLRGGGVTPVILGLKALVGWLQGCSMVAQDVGFGLKQRLREPKWMVAARNVLLRRLTATLASLELRFLGGEGIHLWPSKGDNPIRRFGRWIPDPIILG